MLATLQARYVFPVDGVPIENGSVIVDGDRIAAVGRQSAGEVRDFGNAAIVPGFVNAHTHLDFSDINQPLGKPDIRFVDWLRLVIAFRKEAAATERQPIVLGLRECLRHGTTLLGDIAQPGSFATDRLLDPNGEAWPTVTAFLEIIGPTADRFAKAMELAEQHCAQAASANGLTAAPSKWQAGLSPHAPYSVHPELLAALARLSAERRIPVAMHLAETPEELQLLRYGDGPLREFLDELGVWDAAMLQPGRRPLDYLRVLASTHRALVVHGGYLEDDEIRFLAENAERMGVVYCPRTHEWFGRQRYPLEKMLAGGVPVALGTDGRGSSPDLGLLGEMRCVARRHPLLRLRHVLQMGTIDGARVLGCDAEVGTLAPGKLADLTVIALPRIAAPDPHELLFHADASVAACYGRGQMR